MSILTKIAMPHQMKRMVNRMSLPMTKRIVKEETNVQSLSSKGVGTGSLTMKVLTKVLMATGCSPHATGEIENAD